MMAGVKDTLEDCDRYQDEIETTMGDDGSSWELTAETDRPCRVGYTNAHEKTTGEDARQRTDNPSCEPKLARRGDYCDQKFLKQRGFLVWPTARTT